MSSKAYIEKLCNQSIKGYLDYKGIQYTYDNPNTLRLVDHDSLVVSLLPDKTIFMWNSRNIGGNVFNFIKHYEGIKDNREVFKELRKLSNYLGTDYSDLDYVPEKKQYNPAEHKGVESHDKVKNYLVNTRKINPQIVESLFKADLLRQNSKGNALFVWKNHGKEVGSDEQGTSFDFNRFKKRGTLKKISAGSKSNFGFNFSVRPDAQKQKFFVFESPIDALSFYQMYITSPENKKDEGYRFLSLNGAGGKLNSVVEFTKVYGIPDELHINLDNDQAGIMGFMQASLNFNALDGNVNYIDKNGQSKSFKLKTDSPVGNYKDWNEALKNKDLRFETLNPKEYIQKASSNHSKEIYNWGLEVTKHQKDVNFNASPQKSKTSSINMPKVQQSVKKR